MTLRSRLLAAIAAVLVVVAIGGVTVVRTQRDFLIDQVDEQLAAALPFARPPIVRDAPIRPTPAAPVAPDAPISALFVAFVEDGSVTALLQGQLIDDVPDVPVDDAELDALSSQPVTVDGVQSGSRFRMRVTQLPEADGHLVVALPLDEVDSAVRRLQLVLLIVGALILAIIASAVWWVERLGIRPIGRVTRVAEAISAGDRSQRVPPAESTTEAGKLAQAFNVMLDDRDEIERRRRQFVADASHELRTPLTSIRGYLDLYEQGRFRESAEIDDMVRRMGREATRMRDLVEDLLLLANLDQQRPLRHDDVDLAQLITDAASDARAVQPERTILVDTPPAGVAAIGDVFRLQQVVGALIDNALTHTGPDVTIRLAARTTRAGVELIVADDGPGLDADLAARVFDRFVRGDESRSRRTGNSGLGLAIARSIVEAHGGTIELDTSPGRGCTFTITLPPGGARIAEASNRPDADPAPVGDRQAGDA